MVPCLLELARCLASAAIHAKIYFTNKSLTFMASWERFRPGYTCLSNLGK